MLLGECKRKKKITYRISVVHSKTVMKDVLGYKGLSRYYSVLSADYGSRLMRLEGDVKLEQTANTLRDSL